MNDKIMDLIELAMQIKGTRYASVDFNGYTQSVTLFISDSITHKPIKRLVCYLDSNNTEKIFNVMQGELNKLLIEKAA